MTGLWTWIRGIGGNRDEEADLREELGREDPGEAEEQYLTEAGYGASGGFAFGEAAEVAEADLDETKPPRDPAP
jgi:hypothetical protein